MKYLGNPCVQRTCEISNVSDLKKNKQNNNISRQTKINNETASTNQEIGEKKNKAMTCHSKTV